MSQNDPLLQPFQLKGLTLPNRVVSTSHEPAYSVDGMPKERYRLYQVEKARGGVGLTMIGGSAIVAPDSPPAFGNLCVWKDEIVPWFRELSDAVHEHGTAVMCQITHLGRRTAWNQDDWLPVIAPSPLREPAHRSFPKVMETHDIERVIKAYGDAALRCREGGLDGIEIEAYGHLFDAFWSRAWNQRDDEYGGSLDNRMRFGMEVLAEIRRRVGPDFAVGIRMVVDEDLPGGIDQTEGLGITRRLSESGGIDFINYIQGHIDTDEGLSHVIPGMGTPAAPYLELARSLREVTDLPLMHAARIADVATARHALGEGLLDLVGMTRAHMADPHIVAKVKRGEEHRIRPCVGVGYCIDRIYESGEALCIHNPATGREALLPHSLDTGPGAPRKVVVVGAGPAGLEAARVAAARGHEVVLFEAADAPGGQLRLAAKLDRRREIIGIADWLASELDILGVDQRYNQYAEASDVLAETPDVVVIATGGLPNTDFLESGADLVLSSWDVLGGDAVAGRVLLFDDNGAHPGLSCAEFLVGKGVDLEFVTPERVLAPEIGGTNYPAYFKALHGAETRFTLNHRLSSVARRNGGLVAALYNEYTRRTVERSVDAVVVEHGTLALDDLYHELKQGSRNQGELDLTALVACSPQTITRNPKGRYQLFRVGDAVASRNIHAALHDALRLCIAL
jgi:2,4-dienoyl-CoA reductase-like NADH-dependent reductase (Old Yellow Enzyme family)